MIFQPTYIKSDFCSKILLKMFFLAKKLSSFYYNSGEKQHLW